MRRFNLKLGDNYILWSLIYIPALIIAIAVFRFDARLDLDEKADKKWARTLFSQEQKKGPDPFFKNPPEIIKAVYLTSSSGGNEKKINWLIDLAKKSELNAVVIDIKDFSGYVAYDTRIADVKKYKAERLDIKDIDGLIKKLHDHNIYVIARITVFQDPVLVRARPDWAVKNKYTGGIWYDRNGLSWVNPVASESWDYYIDISRDAVKRGFDELNYDYIRFPSDGDMTALVFQGWNGKKAKADIIGEFYKYLRESLPEVRLSADLFGFVTTHTDDLGIGQLMEKAFAAFDYICPMVYPSHYPPKYLGFENPAVYPYEVVHTSMKGGIERLRKYKLEHPENQTEFRPWLQDFKLGADYTQAMVEAEIKATQDALGENYRGFMLWNASNNYHEGVLGKK